MKISLTFLLLILGSALPFPQPATLTNGNRMYPYGEAVGDEKTPKDDDGTSPKISLYEPYNFFNKTYHSAYINNNGVVSFEKQVSGYTPKSIPLTDGIAFVAPYWGDVNNELGGDVYYRQVKDPEELDRITKEINQYYPDIPFKAHWGLIATWDHVAYFGSTSNKTNTFQAILASDSATSFVILNYDNIEWTTGTASGGNPKTGLGGTPAQAGFNTGDDKNYFSIPGSRRHEILNITKTSNVHVPGLWIFQMNEFKPTGIPEELMKLTVPVEEEPQAPVEEEPQAPVAEEPQAPVPEEPQAPVVEEPQAPVVEEPQAPVAEEPQAPVPEEPQAPMVEDPQAPVAEEPQAPVSEEPQAPVAEEPKSPKVEEPQAPMEEEPKVPEEEEPQYIPMDYEEDDNCEEYEW